MLATTTPTYDLAGNLTATQDPLGRATRFEYDAENRRVRMLHPDDTAKSFAYDALDRMIAETNELGHTTKRAYDAYGNLVGISAGVPPELRPLSFLLAVNRGIPTD